MIEKCFISDGLQIFSDWIIPEGMITRRLDNFYKNHPIPSRALVVPIAVASGTIKTLLFPIMCLVGVIVMPIIALIGQCSGKLSGRAWMQAWGCCLLGLAASIGLVAGILFMPPTTVGLIFLVSAVALSIIMHVYKMVKEPHKVSISM